MLGFLQQEKVIGIYLELNKGDKFATVCAAHFGQNLLAASQAPVPKHVFSAKSLISGFIRPSHI